MPLIILILSLALWFLIGLGLSAAFGSPPTPGTTDPEVVRWITEDLVADDRSALSLDGQGVRFVGQEGGGGIVTPETIPAVPLPATVWMILAALAALIWKGWK